MALFLLISNQIQINIRFYALNHKKKVRIFLALVLYHKIHLYARPSDIKYLRCRNQGI